MAAGFQTKKNVIPNSLGQGFNIAFAEVSITPRINYDPWQAELSILTGQFSDNNRRKLISGEVLRNIYRLYEVYLGPAVIHFNDSRPNTNRGYYNPSHYTELAAIYKSSIPLNEKWNVSPYIKMGVFSDDIDDSFRQKLFDIRLSITNRISLYQELSFNLSYFNSGAGSIGGVGGGGGGGQGYRSLNATLNYHHFFK